MVQPPQKRAGASLWRGTSILLVSNLLYRTIEFAYRIALVRMIGAEAVGLFQVVVPLYLLLLLLAGAGVPPAVGNLVADRMALGDRAGARRVARTALVITLVGGTLAAGILLGAAEGVAGWWLRDPRVSLALLAMAPSLLIVAVAGVYRGYFQGLQRMEPVAGAQLAEQVTSSLSTLALVWLLRPLGTEYLLAALGIGVTLGELMGLVWMARAWAAEEQRPKPLGWPNRKEGGNELAVLLAEGHEPLGVALRPLARLALPITLARLAGTVSLAVMSRLIPSRLAAAGYTHAETLALYGQLTGMAFPLISLPTVITFALAYNLVPAVSAAQSRGVGKETVAIVEQALRATQTAALPLALLLLLYPGEISFLAFGTAAPAPIIAILALASPFLYLEQVLSGVIHGLGRPSQALVNFVIGETITLLLCYWWIPLGGLRGAALAMAAGTCLEAALDYRAAARVLPSPPSLWRIFRQPLVAGAAMAVALWATRMPLAAAGSSAATILLVALYGLLVYALVWRWTAQA